MSPIVTALLTFLEQVFSQAEPEIQAWIIAELEKFLPQLKSIKK